MGTDYNFNVFLLVSSDPCRIQYALSFHRSEKQIVISISGNTWKNISLPFS